VLPKDPQLFATMAEAPLEDLDRLRQAIHGYIDELIPQFETGNKPAISRTTLPSDQSLGELISALRNLEGVTLFTPGLGKPFLVTEVSPQNLLVMSLEGNRRIRSIPLELISEMLEVRRLHELLSPNAQQTVQLSEDGPIIAAVACELSKSFK
jgi:hypothetical protein